MVNLATDLEVRKIMDDNAEGLISDGEALAKLLRIHQLVLNCILTVSSSISRQEIKRADEMFAKEKLG